jgi:hypothetical protein
MLPISAIMFSTLRQGAISLGASTDATRTFVLNRINPDGGLQGRTGQSDLYYTAFGIDLLHATAPIPDSPFTIHAPLTAYLLRFGSGDNLGFMDLVSLTRARSRLMPDQTPPEWRQSIANHITRFRAADGGYASQSGSSVSSATATYMARIAFESLGIDPDNPATLCASLASLATPDGAFSNLPGMPAGNTQSTAASLILLNHFGWQPPGGVPPLGITAPHGNATLVPAGLTPLPHTLSPLHPSPFTPPSPSWLLDRLDDSGGFLSFPNAPIPDLLASGTALFALSCLAATEPPLPPELIAACQAFITARRGPSGGYTGHAFDTVEDVEYTYYALLALGSLHVLASHSSPVP